MTLFGLVVAQWAVADVVARDVFIAAGLAVRLKGTTLAALTRTSPAHVARVGARTRGGGFAALATRRPGGRTPTLTPAQRARALQRRRRGETVATIATALGVLSGLTKCA